MISQITVRPVAGVERLDIRAAIGAASAMFYALAFLPLHQVLGHGVVS